MSYRQTIRRTISIHYSGTVSYPASKSGGTVGYSGVVHEDVEVNVDVDTEPFDKSVDNCNQHVNLLTGAVVVAEAEQTKSIKDNAIKVGNAIIGGFFKTVQSEISQQIAELKIRIDANLTHLAEMAKRCSDKKHQMEVDYNRICDRYMKIFTELNGELETRIFELDKPAFMFKRDHDKTLGCTLQGDMPGTVAVSGEESSKLGARLEATVLKSRANEAICKATKFLERQNITNDLLKDCSINESKNGGYYLPVCYMETYNEGDVVDKKIFNPSDVFEGNEEVMLETVGNKNFNRFSKEEKTQIYSHFSRHIGMNYSESSTHNDRIKECMVKLFNQTNA